MPQYSVRMVFSTIALLCFITFPELGEGTALSCTTSITVPATADDFELTNCDEPTAILTLASPTIAGHTLRISNSRLKRIVISGTLTSYTFELDSESYLDEKLQLSSVMCTSSSFTIKNTNFSVPGASRTTSINIAISSSTFSGCTFWLEGVMSWTAGTRFLFSDLSTWKDLSSLTVLNCYAYCVYTGPGPSGNQKMLYSVRNSILSSFQIMMNQSSGYLGYGNAAGVWDFDGCTVNNFLLSVNDNSDFSHAFHSGNFFRLNAGAWDNSEVTISNTGYTPMPQLSWSRVTVVLISAGAVLENVKITVSNMFKPLASRLYLRGGATFWLSNVDINGGVELVQNSPQLWVQASCYVYLSQLAGTGGLTVLLTGALSGIGTTSGSAVFFFKLENIVFSNLNLLVRDASFDANVHSWGHVFYLTNVKLSDSRVELIDVLLKKWYSAANSVNSEGIYGFYSSTLQNLSFRHVRLTGSLSSLWGNFRTMYITSSIMRDCSASFDESDFSVGNKLYLSEHIGLNDAFLYNTNFTYTNTSVTVEYNYAASIHQGFLYAMNSVMEGANFSFLEGSVLDLGCVDVSPFHFAGTSVLNGSSSIHFSGGSSVSLRTYLAKTPKPLLFFDENAALGDTTLFLDFFRLSFISSLIEGPVQSGVLTLVISRTRVYSANRASSLIDIYNSTSKIVAWMDRSALTQYDGVTRLPHGGDSTWNLDCCTYNRGPMNEVRTVTTGGSVVPGAITMTNAYCLDAPAQEIDSYSVSFTSTLTFSPSHSRTFSFSPSDSGTASFTITPPPTMTPSFTHSETPSFIRTLTFSPSRSRTFSFSASNTGTTSFTITPTATHSATALSTGTATIIPTGTSSSKLTTTASISLDITASKEVLCATYSTLNCPEGLCMTTNEGLCVAKECHPLFDAATCIMNGCDSQVDSVCVTAPLCAERTTVENCTAATVSCYWDTKTQFCMSRTLPCEDRTEMTNCTSAKCIWHNEAGCFKPLFSSNLCVYVSRPVICELQKCLLLPTGDCASWETKCSDLTVTNDPTLCNILPDCYYVYTTGKCTNILFDSPILASNKGAFAVIVLADGTYEIVGSIDGVTVFQALFEPTVFLNDVIPLHLFGTNMSNDGILASALWVRSNVSPQLPIPCPKNLQSLTQRVKQGELRVVPFSIAISYDSELGKNTLQGYFSITGVYRLCIQVNATSLLDLRSHIDVLPERPPVIEDCFVDQEPLLIGNSFYVGVHGQFLDNNSVATVLFTSNSSECQLSSNDPLIASSGQRVLMALSTSQVAVASGSSSHLYEEVIAQMNVSLKSLSPAAYFAIFQTTSLQAGSYTVCYWNRVLHTSAKCPRPFNVTEPSVWKSQAAMINTALSCPTGLNNTVSDINQQRCKSLQRWQGDAATWGIYIHPEFAATSFGHLAGGKSYAGSEQCVMLLSPQPSGSSFRSPVGRVVNIRLDSAWIGKSDYFQLLLPRTFASTNDDPVECVEFTTYQHCTLSGCYWNVEERQCQLAVTTEKTTPCIPLNQPDTFHVSRVYSEDLLGRFASLDEQHEETASLGAQILLPIPSSCGVLVTVCSPAPNFHGIGAKLHYTVQDTMCLKDCKDDRGNVRGQCMKNNLTKMWECDCHYGFSGKDCSAYTQCSGIKVLAHDVYASNFKAVIRYDISNERKACAFNAIAQPIVATPETSLRRYGIGFSIDEAFFSPFCGANCSACYILIRKGTWQGPVLFKLCPQEIATEYPEGIEVVRQLVIDSASVYIQYRSAFSNRIRNPSGASQRQSFVSEDRFRFHFRAVSLTCPGKKDSSGLPEKECDGLGDCKPVDYSSPFYLPKSAYECHCRLPTAASVPGETCDTCAFGFTGNFPNCSNMISCGFNCSQNGLCTATGCLCYSGYYGLYCDLLDDKERLGEPGKRFMELRIPSSDRNFSRLGNIINSGKQDKTLSRCLFQQSEIPCRPESRGGVGRIYLNQQYPPMSSTSPATTTVSRQRQQEDQTSSTSSAYLFSDGNDMGLSLNYFSRVDDAPFPDFIRTDSPPLPNQDGGMTLTAWVKCNTLTHGFLYTIVDFGLLGNGGAPPLELALSDIRSRKIPLHRLKLRKESLNVYFAVMLNGRKQRVDMLVTNPVMKPNCTSKESWLYVRHFRLGSLKEQLFDMLWRFFALKVYKFHQRTEGQVFVDGKSIPADPSFVQCLPFLPLSAALQFDVFQNSKNATNETGTRLASRLPNHMTSFWGYHFYGYIDEPHFYAHPLHKRAVAFDGGDYFLRLLYVSPTLLFTLVAICFLVAAFAATFFLQRTWVEETGRKHDALRDHEEDCSEEEEYEMKVEDPMSANFGNWGIFVEEADEQPNNMMAFNEAMPDNSEQHDPNMPRQPAQLQPEAVRSSTGVLVTQPLSSSQMSRNSIVDEKHVLLSIPSPASESSLDDQALFAQPSTEDDDIKQNHAAAVEAKSEGMEKTTNTTLCTRREQRDSIFPEYLPYEAQKPCRRRSSINPPSLNADEGQKPRSRRSSINPSWNADDQEQGIYSSEALKRREGYLEIAKLALGATSVVKRFKSAATERQQRGDAATDEEQKSESKKYTIPGEEDVENGRSPTQHDDDEKEKEKQDDNNDEQEVVDDPLVILNALGELMKEEQERKKGGGAGDTSSSNALSKTLGQTTASWQVVSQFSTVTAMPLEWHNILGKVSFTLALDFFTGWATPPFHVMFYFLNGAAVLCFLIIILVLFFIKKYSPIEKVLLLREILADRVKFADEVIRAEKRLQIEIEEGEDDLCRAEESNDTDACNTIRNTLDLKRDKIQALSVRELRVRRSKLYMTIMLTTTLLSFLYMPATQYALTAVFCHPMIACLYDCYHEELHNQLVYLGIGTCILIGLGTPMLFSFVVRRADMEYRELINTSPQFEEGVERDSVGGSIEPQEDKSTKMSRIWQVYVTSITSPFSSLYNCLHYNYIYFETSSLIFRATLCTVIFGLDAESVGQLLCVVFLYCVFGLICALARPYLELLPNLALTISNVFVLLILSLRCGDEILPHSEAIGWTMVVVGITALTVQFVLVMYILYGFIAWKLKQWRSQQMEKQEREQQEKEQQEKEQQERGHELGEGIDETLENSTSL